MFGMKPKPVEHANLMQPFIHELAQMEHQLQFRPTDAFPHNEREDRGKPVGAGWVAKDILPSGLEYGLAVYSDTRRQGLRGNEHATLTLSLSLRHPEGQLQHFTWMTDGTGGFVNSQRPVERGWGIFKRTEIEGEGREMTPAEVRKLVSLVRRFATHENLKTSDETDTQERERTRLVEGVKNIQNGR